VVGQIHPWPNGLVSAELVQAMQHAIQVWAAIGERLLNGVLQQGRWVLLM
jgi:hypothetical protein